MRGRVLPPANLDEEHLEVRGLNLAKKGRLFLLWLTVVVFALTGCMPRGAMTNPGWTVVAAADDVVYAALASGRVVALDAASGEELWAYPLQAEKGAVGCSLPGGSSDNGEKPLDAVYGLPVVTGDVVLIASYDHHLYAFDRATGEREPLFTADDAIIGGVTVYDGVTYFGASDYLVYAVDLATREAIWEKPFRTGNWVWGTPAVDEERIYVGSMDHHVYAINRRTGIEEWRRDMGASVPGSITLSGGTLFVGAIDKQLHVLDAENGRELWQRPMGDWVWGEALVHDGYVYAGSLDGRVHALSLSDQSPRWDPATLDGAVRAGPILVNGGLTVGTEAGTVYRIDVETGDGEVFFDAKGAVLSRPALLGDMLYLGTTVGNVFGLDSNLSHDPQVWVYPPEESD